MKSRQWALLCSVIHYGLSNLSAKGTPASAETVVGAARKFQTYLDEEETLEPPTAAYSTFAATE